MECLHHEKIIQQVDDMGRRMEKVEGKVDEHDKSLIESCIQMRAVTEFINNTNIFVKQSTETLIGFGHELKVVSKDIHELKEMAKANEESNTIDIRKVQKAQFSDILSKYILPISLIGVMLYLLISKAI